MDRLAWILATLALFIHAQCILGSKITFETTPAVTQTTLTHTIRMRCALSDSVTPPSGGLVVVGDVVVGRSVTGHTASDVAHVTSVVVLRDGADVASVSQFQPATAFTDQGQIHVTGHVTADHVTSQSGTAGERAYLELRWTYPDTTQSGNYTCEVNGVSGAGHAVVLTKSKVMDVATPTINDLVHYIHNHDLAIQNQDNIIQQRINESNAKAQEVESKLHAVLDQAALATQSKIDQLTTSMQSQIDHLTATLLEKDHLENGTLDCGDSDLWTQVDPTNVHLKYTIVRKQFKKAYTKVPIVRWSVSDYDYDIQASHATTIRYHVNVIETTTTGFAVKCSVIRTTYIQMRTLKLHWTGLPQ